MFGLLSGRGPDVPVSTWVPGAATAPRAPAPTRSASSTPPGPKALLRLLEAGVQPPEGFRRTADHPRRGLVLEGPAGTDPATLLQFLFAASDVLATGPLPDTWAASVHRR